MRVQAGFHEATKTYKTRGKIFEGCNFVHFGCHYYYSSSFNAARNLSKLSSQHLKHALQEELSSMPSDEKKDIKILVSLFMWGCIIDRGT